MAFAIELIVQVAAFAAVVALVVILVRFAEGQMAIRRRLDDDRDASPAAAQQLLKERTVTRPVLRWVEDAFLNNAVERNKLRADLVQAGFENPTAPVWYVTIRFSLAIGLPILFIVLTAATGRTAGGP